MNIDKQKLFDRLIEAVETNLRHANESQRSSQDGAVHSEAKQESDKDTRAIESQYLARGLAQRVEELEETVVKLRAMKLRDFGDDDPIAISALVRLEENGESTLYLVAPAGGGRKIEQGDQTIAVITPSSPVGRALLGKRLGDEVAIRAPGHVRACEIVGVS